MAEIIVMLSILIIPQMFHTLLWDVINYISPLVTKHIEYSNNRICLGSLLWTQIKSIVP